MVATFKMTYIVELGACRLIQLLLILIQMTGSLNFGNLYFALSWMTEILHQHTVPMFMLDCINTSKMGLIIEFVLTFSMSVQVLLNK